MYANQKTQEAYEMTSQKDRRRRHMTELDRWALPFVTGDQMKELWATPQTSPLSDGERIAEIIFGN